MKNVRKEVIISCARMLRNMSNNPKELAHKLNFYVIAQEEIAVKFLKAKAYKIHDDGNVTNIIMINDLYDDLGKDILCIHELGHIILGHLETKRGKNLYYDDIETEYEYEANLFSVAYFFNDEDFNIPLKEMSNYTLKTILDKNIKLS